MNDNDQDGPVIVKVPVIIDKDRFLRIVVRRTSRSPRNTPPLHVNPKSPLTGLCICGLCKSPMHIATGKSGRYRYLKCNRRNSVSNSSCSSPNVPYEKFLRLVLQTIIDYVLTESRLSAIIEDCRRNVDSLGASQSNERKQLTDLKGTIERKLNNLYKFVEDGNITIDPTLNSRLKGWQDELNEVSQKLRTYQVPIALPKNILDQIDISAFRLAILSILADSNSPEANSFIHLVVQEIRIYSDEATVTGANLGVLEALLIQKRNTAPAVPSFIPNWRRERDSNPRWDVIPHTLSRRAIL
ncbi:MAG: zinc ribbon domain-containing protein [Betaproteobacteria bacterium]